MSSTGLSKAEEELWMQAEGIFQRYNKQEFDIDPKVGATSMTVTRKWREDGMFGTKDKKEVTHSTLLDIFTHAITDWVRNRGDSFSWYISACELVEAHGYVRNNHGIIPGQPIVKQLQEKDEQIKVLQAQIDELKQKVDQSEKRIQSCNEALLERENRLATKQEELDRLRSQDMMHSMSNNTLQSGVESGDENNNDKDEDEEDERRY